MNAIEFLMKEEEFQRALEYFVDACEKFGYDPKEAVDEVIKESGLGEE